MKVTLVFVPPGGGEADYSLDFELPALPRVGDYISIRRGALSGSEDFIVRLIRWNLITSETRPQVVSGDAICGGVGIIAIECEFAKGPHSSESHKRACAVYEGHGTPLKEFDDSGY